MAYKVEQRIRQGTPQVGVAPYRQIHAHSTGNPRSTAQNEADYYHNKNMYDGTFSHIVGNGRVIQVGEVGRGFWDVGGGWNAESYAAVELIESHATRAEFEKDYKIYCELLHDLAKQGGIPLTVDDGNLAGIKTHNYCTYHQPSNKSDHVDPIPYLAKWGINLAKFRNDVTNAKGNIVNNNIETPKEDTNNNIKLGEIGMFIYYNRVGKRVDQIGVWGNKRFHLDTKEKVQHFSAMVKNFTGKEVKVYRDWAERSEQIRTVESFTEVQKTVTK